MELELAVLRPPLPHALVLQVVHVLRAGPGRVLLIAAARVTALSKTHLKAAGWERRVSRDSRHSASS